jgi:hypothetical protein
MGIDPEFPRNRCRSTLPRTLLLPRLLLRAGVDLMLAGDIETGKAILRD